MLIKCTEKCYLNNNYLEFTTEEGLCFYKKIQNKDHDIEEYLRKLYVGNCEKFRSLCNDLDTLKRYGVIYFEANIKNQTLTYQSKYPNIEMNFNSLIFTA